MATPYRLREEPAHDDAARPAEPRPLGRRRSLHQTGATMRRVLAAMTGVAGVLAVLAVAWPHAPALVACALLLAFAVGAWVVVASILGLDVVAEVHENGLVVRRSWRRPAVVRFDDVHSLHVDASTWTFVLANGRRAIVPRHVSDEARLRAAIEANVERPVLAAAIASLAGGEPLTFGPLTLELDGVRHLGDLLAWSDVDRVKVTEGAFVFVRKTTEHAFFVVPTRTLPFPRVLVALLARRTEVEPPPSAGDDAFWMRWV